MKILMITPYVTIAGRPEFERNKTGFGYMVHDIAQAVGEIEHVEVLTTDSRGASFYEGGVLYLGRSIWQFLCHFNRRLPSKSITSLLKKYKMGRGSCMRLWYYWMMTGYIDWFISKGGYDVIHIHGCAYCDDFWMEVCKRHSKKYVVTLHGLNSFSDAVRLELPGKKYERDFLKRVVEGEFPITVISTGLKRTIEAAFDKKSCRNITVVCNSFNFNVVKKSTFSVRDKFGISKEGKILLYVGNIGENKNQRQMVEAYHLLPDDVRENIWVLFCGRPSADGEFENDVQNDSDSSHIILCGSVERSVIGNYYREAAGVALLSRAEGFGLSLIEGMHFGVPCTMFTDMEAFPDIYNPCAVVPIEERSNMAVARALEILLKNDWNKDSIIDYSDKFSSVKMASNYIKAYQDE